MVLKMEETMARLGLCEPKLQQVSLNRHSIVRVMATLSAPVISDMRDSRKLASPGLLDQNSTCWLLAISIASP